MMDLDRELPDFPLKGPDSNYFRLCGPHDLCCPREDRNERAWLCSKKKTLLVGINILILHSFYASQNFLLLIFSQPFKNAKNYP